MAQPTDARSPVDVDIFGQGVVNYDGRCNITLFTPLLSSAFRELRDRSPTDPISDLVQRLLTEPIDWIMRRLWVIRVSGQISDPEVDVVPLPDMSEMMEPIRAWLSGMFSSGEPEAPETPAPPVEGESGSEGESDGRPEGDR